MLRSFVLGPVLLLNSLALADAAWAAAAACPPACVAGGGPIDTDCFLQFGGITSATVTCADGDPTCDTDGVVNGVCAIPLTVCTNTAGSGCTATPLSRAPSVKGKKDPNATVLNSALGQLSLSETACTTAPYLVKVKVDLSGLKPGVSKLSFKATAGKKTDKDKLVLTCNPGAAPSLADVVQPILTDRCFSTPTCHQSSLPRMESGDTYANTVGVASASFFGHGRKVIEPGSVKESYLARKILAKGLSRGDSAMPQGCPLQEPCLTDEETAQILTWIQAGAPNN